MESITLNQFVKVYSDKERTAYLNGYEQAQKDRRVYVVETEYAHENEDKIMDRAEQTGLVFTLQGFADAINRQELFIDDRYHILIK